MSDQTKSQIGAIEWRDLTVPDAVGVKDFYSHVVGWHTEPVSMGDYNDFNMNLPDSGEIVAGVCHARGCNDGIPAQWLMYVRVADIRASVASCHAHGGKVVKEIAEMGKLEFCIVQDPAGAVLGLIADIKAS